MVSQSVPTCAEADIILKQLKALYKQHISKWSKDFTNKLSEEMNKFFERVSTVLTGKYYDEFYHILIQIHMLREKESDKRISVDN